MQNKHRKKDNPRDDSRKNQSAKIKKFFEHQRMKK